MLRDSKKPASGGGLFLWSVVGNADLEIEIAQVPVTVSRVSHVAVDVRREIEREQTSAFQ